MCVVVAWLPDQVSFLKFICSLFFYPVTVEVVWVVFSATNLNTSRSFSLDSSFDLRFYLKLCIYLTVFSKLQREVVVLWLPHFNANKNSLSSPELTRKTGDQSSRIQTPQQRTSAGMKALIFTMFSQRYPSWHPHPPLLLYVASLISEVIKHKTNKKVGQKLISCTSRSGK